MMMNSSLPYRSKPGEKTLDGVTWMGNIGGWRKDMGPGSSAGRVSDV